MLRITEIKLPIELADTLIHQDDHIKTALLKRLEIIEGDLIRFSIFKRGVDARKSHAILYVYNLDVEVKNEAKILAKFKKDPHIKPAPDTSYKFVAFAPQQDNLHPKNTENGIAQVNQGGEARATQIVHKVQQRASNETNAELPRKLHSQQHRPVVVGFGPAGIFAALILAQSGFNPIVLERGKEVRKRTKDTWGLWRKNTLNPESNVQFGEGGAGTFSDGKLYSQIKDPKHYGRKVIHEFVKAGAPPEIEYVSHPHIGTFRLVGMVEEMRNTIKSLGGEIRFESRVDDIAIEPNAKGEPQVQGVTLQTGEFIATNHLILAVGHSARDTFEMIHKKGIYVEAKPFSIGFRIEHPQGLIDRARYGKSYSEDILNKLGAADYRLVHHAKNGRSVYSFCMCPGGTVVAAASEPNRVVTNGMSQYSRNERNANAGIVVGITPEVDYPDHPLAGMEFQRKLESHAFVLGGGNYNAPGQLIGDFLANKPSTQFGEVMPSYTPGVTLTNLDTALPEFAITAMREAIPAFAKQVPGFDLADGVLTGVETRTSSPIRIKREDDTLESINTKGLYPCGEGAGYAGGILSAGVDGIKVAEAVALSLVKR
jgi:uncharacterized FAD-dependent dehydrogenase